MRITKKDLQQQYDISLNTVRRTLLAIGVSTNSRTYSAEELKNFDQARQLFEAGLSAQEVTQVFQSPIKQINQV